MTILCIIEKSAATLTVCFSLSVATFEATVMQNASNGFKRAQTLIADAVLLKCVYFYSRDALRLRRPIMFANAWNERRSEVMTQDDGDR